MELTAWPDRAEGAYCDVCRICCSMIGLHPRHRAQHTLRRRADATAAMVRCRLIARDGRRSGAKLTDELAGAPRRGVDVLLAGGVLRSAVQMAR
eukprot:5027770-Pleurochrysis_carterae.AAC.2